MTDKANNNAVQGTEMQWKICPGLTVLREAPPQNDTLCSEVLLLLLKVGQRRVLYLRIVGSSSVIRKELCKPGLTAQHGVHHGLLLDRVESSAHLKEISEGEVFIVGRLGDRRPHLPEVLLPSLDQALQGRPCAVAEDKQQHCSPLVGRWGEELQVHL